MSKLISNILSAFLLVTLSIASDDKDTICPISGGMIKGSTVKAKYKDGNISFCSESCKVDFSKNTKKYSALGNCFNRSICSNKLSCNWKKIEKEIKETKDCSN